VPENVERCSRAAMEGRLPVARTAKLSLVQGQVTL
jgi:hypothetical protein